MVKKRLIPEEEKVLLKQEWNARDRVRYALHFFEKETISNKELEEILKLNFETGEFYDDDPLAKVDVMFKLDIIGRLFEMKLITKKILRKLIGYENGDE